MADEVKSFGREDINECMAYLKGKLRGGVMDGSTGDNRRYCNHLIGAMKKEYPNSDPVVCVKRIINIAFMDSWHMNKATGFRYLYYNKGTLIQIGLAQRPEKPKYRMEGGLRKWD